MKKSSKTIRQKTVDSAGESASNDFMTMAEAIEILKTTRPTFYRWVRAGRIKATKVGRQWRFRRDDIDRFIQGDAPRIELPVDISPLIRTLREKIGNPGLADALRDLPKTTSLVAEAVTLMIAAGVATKSGAVHITTHSADARSIGLVRCRIDGVLHTMAEFDVRLLPGIVEEWKRMASCDVREKTKPQDGRIQIGICGTTADLRVNILPAFLGESVTARILDPGAVNIDIQRMGFAPAEIERLRRILKNPSGLIVVTGPTGSGKTTTLYGCLNALAGSELKIMSVEDPVEYILPWVTQVGINQAAGLTFPYFLRAILRADPDVVLIGEIRDLETLSIAQQVALTGHVVLTSLHTDGAAAALRRMVDVGSNPFVVGDATKLVIGQRLVRRLCPHCSARETPSRDALDEAVALSDAGGLKWDDLPRRFAKPVGCDRCNLTGFRGRAVVGEMLEMTPEIAKALREDATAGELTAIAVKQGMTTMAADGIRRAAAGETSLGEVLRLFGKR